MPIKRHPRKVLIDAIDVDIADGFRFSADETDFILAQSETARFKSKRVSGKMVGKSLETLCAFAIIHRFRSAI